MLKALHVKISIEEIRRRDKRGMSEEIKAIDKLVAQEKKKAKIYKAGDDFKKAIEAL